MEKKSKTLNFKICNYDYFLTSKECDEFIRAVVDSAFPVSIDENGIATTTYDPLSKWTAIKMNIVKFYGNLDFKTISMDVLYEMCSDINIEDLKKQDGLNVNQFEDVLKSIDEQCEYLKQQLLFSSINNDSIIEIISEMINDKFSIIQPILDSLSELDVDVMKKMFEKISNGDFDIDEEKLVDIITNSPKFQEHQDTTVERLQDIVKNSKPKKRIKLKKVIR